jgi:hypothetical protein
MLHNTDNTADHLYHVSDICLDHQSATSTGVVYQGRVVTWASPVDGHRIIRWSVALLASGCPVPVIS